MERIYDIEIPAHTMAETMTYAHRTRVADFMVPAVEHILQPEHVLPAHQKTITLETCRSLTAGENRRVDSGPLGPLKHKVRKAVHAVVPDVDLGQTYALDMRSQDMWNVAHIIHDALGPLRFIEQILAADDTVPTRPVHLILPKKAPPIALRFFEEAGVPVVCTDGAVLADQLAITQEFNLAALPSLEHQPVEPWDTELPKKVYISRRGGRSVLNEPQVHALLRERGYERIYPEDLSISQQWSLLGNATDVVGIHGAGLAALGFSSRRPRGAEPRFRLIELFSPGYANTCFRIYAAVLGGTWVGVRGKLTPEIIEDLDVRGEPLAHHMSSFEVDLESLELALAH